MFQYFSTVSNVAGEGEEDKSDNKGRNKFLITLTAR